MASDGSLEKSETLNINVLDILLCGQFDQVSQYIKNIVADQKITPDQKLITLQELALRIEEKKAQFVLSVDVPLWFGMIDDQLHREISNLKQRLGISEETELPRMHISVDPHSNVSAKKKETTSENLLSLQRRLKNSQENLVLLEKQTHNYVLITDIPVQLLSEIQKTKQRIVDLERDIQSLLAGNFIEKSDERALNSIDPDLASKKRKEESLRENLKVLTGVIENSSDLPRISPNIIVSYCQAIYQIDNKIWRTELTSSEELDVLKLVRKWYSDQKVELSKDFPKIDEWITKKENKFKPTKQ